MGGQSIIEVEKKRVVSHSKKIVINSFFSVGAKLISLVLNFLTRKLFIIFLGGKVLGLDSLFVELLGLLNLADLGLGMSLQFNLYKPIIEKNESKIASLLNAAKKMYNIIGGVVLIFGIVLSFFLQYLIKDNSFPLTFLRVVFILNVINNAVSYFGVHKRLFLQTVEDIYVTNIVDVLINITCYVFKLISVIVLKNYYIYIVIGIFQTIFSNYIIVQICNKRYPYLKKNNTYFKEDFIVLIDNLKQLIPNRISNYVFFCTDNTIISIFMGLEVVTVYTNYSSVVSQAFWASAMIAGVMKVSFGNMMQEDKCKGRHITYLNAYQLLQFLYSSIVGVVLYVLLDDFVIYLYGEEYVISRICVLLFIVDFFAHSMYQPLSMMLEIQGEFISLKVQAYIETMLNIIISVVATYKLGLIGPILGTMVVDFITIGFRMYTCFWKHYRQYTIKEIQKFILFILLFFLELFIADNVMNHFKNSISLSGIMIKGVICIIVTALISIILLYRTEEFQYLITRLKPKQTKE